MSDNKRKRMPAEQIFEEFAHSTVKTVLMALSLSVSQEFEDMKSRQTVASLAVEQDIRDLRERQIKTQACIEELTVALGQVMGALAHIHDQHMCDPPTSSTRFGENLQEKKP